MKRISSRLVMVAVTLSWAHTVSAQTADDIIEKYLAALGGRAALGKLQSRTTTGTIALSTPAGEISGPIVLVNQQPNKSRMLIKLDLAAFGAGEMTLDQRFDGTTGYVLDSMRGNRDITGNQLENMKNTGFPSPLLNYKAAGATVELGGKEKVGDREAYVVIVKPKSGSVARQFFDVESSLLLRVVLKVTLPEVGEVEQTTELSDYREVDGVKVPFIVKASSAVQTSTVTATKVEHNTKVDETLFSKPPAD